MFALEAMITILLLQRGIELMISRRNVHKLLSQGGVEFGKRHYPVIVALHILWFIGIHVEAILRGTELSAWWPYALLAFILAQVLRFMAMITLGRRWTTRVVVVPGEQRISKGIYRRLRHPNYIAVAIELVAVPLMFGAVVTAVVSTILNAAILLLVRIPTEEQALRWAQDEMFRSNHPTSPRQTT